METLLARLRENQQVESALRQRQHELQRAHSTLGQQQKELRRAQEVLMKDMTRRKCAEALLSAEKHTLQKIAEGAALADVLNDLCRGIDEQSPVSCRWFRWSSRIANICGPWPDRAFRKAGGEP